jgi:hypothetical protein
MHAPGVRGCPAWMPSLLLVRLQVGSGPASSFVKPQGSSQWQEQEQAATSPGHCHVWPPCLVLPAATNPGARVTEQPLLLSGGGLGQAAELGPLQLVVHQGPQLLLHHQHLPAGSLQAGSGCLRFSLPVGQLAAAEMLHPGVVRVTVVSHKGQLVASTALLAASSAAVAQELQELFWGMLGSAAAAAAEPPTASAVPAEGAAVMGQAAVAGAASGSGGSGGGGGGGGSGSDGGRDAAAASSGGGGGRSGRRQQLEDSAVLAAGGSGGGGEAGRSRAKDPDAEARPEQPPSSSSAAASSHRGSPAAGADERPPLPQPAAARAGSERGTAATALFMRRQRQPAQDSAFEAGLEEHGEDCGEEDVPPPPRSTSRVPAPPPHMHSSPAGAGAGVQVPPEPVQARACAAPEPAAASGGEEARMLQLMATTYQHGLLPLLEDLGLLLELEHAAAAGQGQQPAAAQVAGGRAMALRSAGPGLLEFLSCHGALHASAMVLQAMEDVQQAQEQALGQEAGAAAPAAAAAPWHGQASEGQGGKTAGSGVGVALKHQAMASPARSSPGGGAGGGSRQQQQMEWADACEEAGPRPSARGSTR